MMYKPNPYEDWQPAKSRYDRVVDKKNHTSVSVLEVRQHESHASWRLGELVLTRKDGEPFGVSLKGLTGIDF